MHIVRVVSHQLCSYPLRSQLVRRGRHQAATEYLSRASEPRPPTACACVLLWDRMNNRSYTHSLQPVSSLLCAHKKAKSPRRRFRSIDGFAPYNVSLQPVSCRMLSSAVACPEFLIARHTMTSPPSAAMAAAMSRLGISAFRQGQEDAVRGVLAGRDVFALLPTGAGKVRARFVRPWAPLAPLGPVAPVTHSLAPGSRSATRCRRCYYPEWRL
jgi:hypothetical protein